MKTRQTIAVIGATGPMGSGIARSLAKENNRLLLFGNDPEKVQTLVDEIKVENQLADVEGAQCPTNASWEADIIILAVPYAAEAELAQKLKLLPTRKSSSASPIHSTIPTMGW
jgi:predicted dinucleotide-binding enzyme